MIKHQTCRKEKQRKGEEKEKSRKSAQKIKCAAKDEIQKATETNAQHIKETERYADKRKCRRSAKILSSQIHRLR